MNTSLTSSPGIRLRDLLRDARFQGARDIQVISCCSDSRSVEPGDLFVALCGVHRDGHDYAQEAVARGASAVLAERPLPISLPTCLVPDTRVAYGSLCQALAGDPCRDLRLVGITGTNGKTTTAQLIAGILNQAGAQTGILGTLGYSDGLEMAAASHTTPPAPVLAHWLARMVASGCSHALMEVSSHALSQARVAGTELDAVCVTNVRSDHLDYHGSVQNYRDVKATILNHVAPTGVVILNADDPVCVSWLAHIHGPVLTIGMHTPAELTATVVERHSSEQTFLLSAGCEHVPVRTKMIGDHHVTNCLVAAALGLVYGLDLPSVVRGLEAVEQVPGRLERIDCGQSFTAMVDYAHTPDALAATLTTLRDVTQGRLICVFGAGGDRDRRKRPVMGSVVARLADAAIITSDNPRTEDPEQIANDILRGAETDSNVRVVLDRALAIALALTEAAPGDCVIIAGKGHETYQVVGDYRVPFDDRQFVRQFLYHSVSGDAPKLRIES